MNVKSPSFIVIEMQILIILLIGASYGSLEFQDDRPIMLTWDQVRSGADIVVCNYGNLSLPSLNVTLDDFNFKINERHVDDKSILDISPFKMSLNGWTCARINISVADRLAGGILPDSGRYKSELVISGQGAGTIRKEISIDVQTYQCALDSLNLTATRDFSFLGKAHLDYSYIPLKSPENGYSPALPKNGTLLGFVYYKGHIGNITVDSKDYKTEAGLTWMPIRIDGLDEVGTYSGKLSLAGINNNLSSVKVVVSVTDFVIWPIIMLAIGLVIALKSLIYLQKKRIIKDIKARWDKVKDGYKNVKFPTLELKYQKGNKKFKSYESPSDDDLDNYEKALFGALEHYAEGKWLFYPDDLEFKKIMKALEDAEKDLELLDASGFGKSLEALNNDLFDLMSFLDIEYYIFKTPSILKSTANLLEGRALQVGEAEKIKDKSESTSDLIKRWMDIARKIKKYYHGIASLDAKPWDKSPEDIDSLLKAYSKVIEANFKLMEVTDSKSLEKMGIDSNLKDACSHLAYLTVRYEKWVSSEKATIPELRWSDEAKVMSYGGTTTKLKEAMAPGHDLLGLLMNLTSTSGTPLKMAEIEKAERWVGDLGVLLLGFSATVLVGLNQLYFGKTFGTALDYFTAFLLGASTETLLSGLKGTIAQFDNPLRSKEESSESKKK
jgi:hypothetical protein